MYKAILGVVALTLGGVNGLYTTERGKYDWHIKTIGEVTDVAFIGLQQAYMLSTDNLLTYYNNGNENVIWRKKLPSNEGESYKLISLDRNLLVYSDERALQINTAGHV